jgi:RNA polymerase sigma factor (sigma-70 family)
MTTATEESTPAPRRNPPAFVTTRWTRVMAARGGDCEAREAMADLCELYYQPVVTFLRCRGNAEDRARDLAHDFFARLLERQSLGKIDPQRGRFRSYLLAAVKNFLADQFDRDHAAKRAGGKEHVELRPASDTSVGVDPADPHALSPETEFDRQWALSVLEQALYDLEREYVAADKVRHFRTLKPWLTGATDAVSQRDAGEELGLNEGAVKVAIHRLRKRFRARVKNAIAQTLPDSGDVDEELSYLMRVMG